MVNKKVSKKTTRSRAKTQTTLDSGICATDALLLAALEGDGSDLETGRFLMSYPEGEESRGPESLSAQGMNVADARDFKDQAIMPDDVAGADALMFPEIGVAMVTGDAMKARSTSEAFSTAMESENVIIEPEYFVFTQNSEYLRGFARAANTIAMDMGVEVETELSEDEIQAEILGSTWGLRACKVPPSYATGNGIKVAVLDTGMDLKHPDFAGRSITSNTFVGQPVHDLNGHGTHCIGTSCGPKAPAGNTPRYGIAHQANIYVGKVLSNAGSGTTAGVLAGINWAIANKCEVISMSLGSSAPPQQAYTNAGSAALKKGLIIVAAAGNSGGRNPTGSPANSPTIFAVASVDQNLQPSIFSQSGKIEIAAPGRDVFSSWPRPRRYNTISGTSMATPHVAGCAALWAQSNRLRGQQLWNKLQSSARRLKAPRARVGAGLVQAP